MPSNYSLINPNNPIRVGSAITNALFPTTGESGVNTRNSYTVPDLDLDDKYGYSFRENFANIADSGTVLRGTNVDLIQTFVAAGPGRSHAIGGISYSYSATPTSGRITVEDGTNVIVYDVDVAAAGPGEINWGSPLTGSGNMPMRIKMQAGGASVVAKLSIKEHYIL